MFVLTYSLISNLAPLENRPLTYVWHHENEEECIVNSQLATQWIDLNKKIENWKIKLFCWRSLFDIVHTFGNKLMVYKIKRISFPKFCISVTKAPIWIKPKTKMTLLIVFFSFGQFFSNTKHVSKFWISSQNQKFAISRSRIGRIWQNFKIRM